MALSAAGARNRVRGRVECRRRASRDCRQCLLSASSAVHLSLNLYSGCRLFRRALRRLCCRYGRRKRQRRRECRSAETAADTRPRDREHYPHDLHTDRLANEKPIPRLHLRTSSKFSEIAAAAAAQAETRGTPFHKEDPTRRRHRSRWKAQARRRIA